jgi:cytochrome c
MPWDKPKSLSTDEVYSVVAYILNMGGIVKADFELSNQNMLATQALMPNRNGLVSFDGMWNTKGKADVSNVACMSNCGEVVKITSFLPDFARNAHGNLAEQNRLIGPVRGADTSKAPPTSLAMAAQAVHSADTSNIKAVANNASEAKKLLASNNCMACHTMKTKLVGPAFASIANKYKNIPDRQAHLMKEIRAGGAGVWGSVPMPPQTELSETDLQKIVQWLADGAQ